MILCQMSQKITNAINASGICFVFYRSFSINIAFPTQGENYTSIAAAFAGILPVGAFAHGWGI